MQTVKARERKEKRATSLAGGSPGYVHRGKPIPSSGSSGEFGGRNDAKKWCDVLTTLARWRRSSFFVKECDDDGIGVTVDAVEWPSRTIRFIPRFHPVQADQIKKISSLEWSCATTCDSASETKTSTSHLAVSRQSLSWMDDDLNERLRGVLFPRFWLSISLHHRPMVGFFLLL
jgi:hypothetical protein